MQDLKTRALRGGMAKLGSQGTVFVLRLGSVMLLARLLDPADFGLVGMVTVVTGAFNLFKDAGLSVATVQRPEITDEQLSTLFWVNVAVGVLLALISVALGPLMVKFYSEPRLFWIAAVLGGGFVLNAAGVQHSALLQRQMRFDALAANEVISWAVSVAVGTVLALLGYGYWALVWMSVSVPAASTIGVWIAAKWMPGRPRSGVDILSMLRFGSTVTLNTLIIYVAYNADKLLIGRLWGATALGIYGRAYQLINIPTDNLNSAVGGVAVSALARVQHDTERFKNYFLKSYSLVLAVTLPVTIACALFADDLIVVLLSAKWRDAISIFRLMAPTIMTFAMLNPLGWLLMSSGRVGRSLRMAVVIAVVVVAGYGAGVPYGATGVAAGYSIAMALLAFPMIAWAIHGTFISWKDVMQAVKPPLWSAVVACVISFFSARLWSSSAPLVRLLLEGGLLTVSYLWMLLFVMGQKPFYGALIRDSRQALTGLQSEPAVG